MRRPPSEAARAGLGDRDASSRAPATARPTTCSRDSAVHAEDGGASAAARVATRAVERLRPSRLHRCRARTGELDLARRRKNRRLDGHVTRGERRVDRIGDFLDVRFRAARDLDHASHERGGPPTAPGGAATRGPRTSAASLAAVPAAARDSRARRRSTVPAPCRWDWPARGALRHGGLPPVSVRHVADRDARIAAGLTASTSAFSTSCRSSTSATASRVKSSAVGPSPPVVDNEVHLASAWRIAAARSPRCRRRPPSTRRRCRAR